jgi:hypothetical protein
MSCGLLQATNDLAETVNALANELSGEDTAAFDWWVEGLPRDLPDHQGRDLPHPRRRCACVRTPGPPHCEISCGENESGHSRYGEGIPAEILEEAAQDITASRNTRTPDKSAQT